MVNLEKCLVGLVIKLVEYVMVEESWISGGFGI